MDGPCLDHFWAFQSALAVELQHGKTRSTLVTNNHPVVAMIFGQTGIMAGAAIEGTKYTRIIPSALASRI